MQAFQFCEKSNRMNGLYIKSNVETNYVYLIERALLIMLTVGSRHLVYGCLMLHAWLIWQLFRDNQKKPSLDLPGQALRTAQVVHN